MRNLVRILLCTSIVICLSCPAIDTTISSTWRISLNNAANTIYFEKIGDSTGYLTANFMATPYYRIHFLAAASVTVSPSPSQLGFQTTSEYNVTMDKISATLNQEVVALGNYCGSFCTWNVTFDGSQTYAGFGSSSDYFEISPYDGYITPGSTCTTYTCYPCDCNCLTCAGPTAEMCTSCPSGKYLTSYRACETVCPQGFYPNSTDNKCYPCNPACFACTGSSTKECQSCQYDYYLQPNSTICSQTCPEGYGFFILNQCAPCRSICGTCTSAGLYGDYSCTTCAENRLFLQPPHNDCVYTCYSGYYADISSQTCKPCDIGCTVCGSAGTNNCTVCDYDAGYYLQPYSTICSQTCPDGFYKHSTGVCSPCYRGCKTCLIGNHDWTYTCTSCVPSYYLHPAQDGNIFECLLNCPDGYYPNSETWTCSPCNLSCSLCSGPLNTNCSKCSLGYYSSPLSPSTCLSSCPVGYAASPGSTTCSLCYLSCLTCSGTTNLDCTSCKSGFFLQPNSNQCLTSCPTKYYKDTTVSKCIACQLECTTCFGPSNSQCNSCQSGYFLQPTSTSCLDSCPLGYWSDSSKNICSSCNLACSICTGPNNNQCSVCSSQHFLQPNSSICLRTCPDGYYPNTLTKACSPCASTCNYCVGPTAADCAICAGGFYLNLLTQKCVTSCSKGYYPNDATRLCSICDPSCFNCFGPTKDNCSSCNSRYFLQPSSSTCLSSCSSAPGHWEDRSTNECSPCSTGCLTCIGPESDSCLSCEEGYVLNAAGNQCNKNCSQQDYYANYTTRTCLQCDKACSSCFGPLHTDCLTCKPGYYMQPSPSSTTCLNSCPIINYCPDDKTGTCGPCSITRSWSLWVAISQVLWFVLTLQLILTKNRNYCIVDKYKERKAAGKGSKYRWASEFAIYFLATHPLLSIYLFKDKIVTKSDKALLFFVRMLVLFDIAAALHQSESLNENPDYSQIMDTFEGLVFVIPFLVLMPLSVILEKIIRAPKCSKKQQIFCCRYLNLGRLLLHAIILTGVVFSFALCSKYSLKEHQVRWLANWIKLILQDMLLSPFVYLVFSLLLVKCVVAKDGTPNHIVRFTKKLIDESVLAIHLALEEKIPLKNPEEQTSPANIIQVSEIPFKEKDGQLQIILGSEIYSPTSRTNTDFGNHLLQSWRPKNANNQSMNMSQRDTGKREIIAQQKFETPRLSTDFLVLDPEIKRTEAIEAIEQNVIPKRRKKPQKKKHHVEPIAIDDLCLEFQSSPYNQQNEQVQDDEFIPNPGEMQYIHQIEEQDPQPENIRQELSEKEKEEAKHLDQNQAIISQFAQEKQKTDPPKAKGKKKKKIKDDKKMSLADEEKRIEGAADAEVVEKNEICQNEGGSKPQEPEKNEERDFMILLNSSQL